MGKELVKSQIGSMPAFMQGSDLGVEDLGQYVIPPRLKVLQPLSDRETFLSKFDVGDVIAVPQMVLVAPTVKDEKDKPTEDGEPFHFIPVFFFPEWCLWNPIQTRGTLPAIVARTTDPTSTIAAKSRSPALWNEPCPEAPEFMCRYVEHLNFVIVILGDHDLTGIPVIMSFSRAEHRRGSNFASLIKMRKAPLYGCQFEARVGPRSNNKGHWYGIDVTNPSGDSGIEPFVQEKDVFGHLEGLHLEYKKAHEDAKIRVDYEDTLDEPSDTVADEDEC
jgi:hypothetical protein